MYMMDPRESRSNAPPYRTALQNHATLLVSWWCTIFAAVIILFRLSGRYVRSERLFREDKIMAWAMVPLFARMAFAHVLMLWGTNNVQTAGLTALEISHASTGARLVLACRIAYACFIWMAKWTVSEFLSRLVESFWTKAYGLVLRGIRAFLIITFIVVFIATLAECQPFDHYWQVVPAPGASCRDGYAQVIAMASCDVLTDTILVAFPIPIFLIHSDMHWKRKASLSMLFMTSLILIAITIYRVVTVTAHHGSQQVRTLWASIEILAAAAVANALILGSFVRDRGVKKARKYKGYADRRKASVDEPSSITKVMTRHHWGSDEDLFRSVGGRMNSVTEHHFDDLDPDEIRHAPPLPLLSRRDISDINTPKQPHVQSTPDVRPAPSSSTPTHDQPNTADAMRFFDAGGILEQGPSPPDTATSNRSPSSTLVQSDYSPTDTRNLTRTAAPTASPRQLPVHAPSHSQTDALAPHNHHNHHIRSSHNSSKRNSHISHASTDVQDLPDLQLEDAGGLLGVAPSTIPPQQPRGTDADDEDHDARMAHIDFTPNLSPLPASPAPPQRPRSLIQVLRESRVRAHSPASRTSRSRSRSRPHPLASEPISNAGTPHMAPSDADLELQDAGGLLALDETREPPSMPRDGQGLP